MQNLEKLAEMERTQTDTIYFDFQKRDNLVSKTKLYVTYYQTTQTPADIRHV